MSEMVERVTQALFMADEPPAPAGWNDLAERWRNNYRGMARAALEAMREPTEAMMSEHSQIQITGYRDMIDEALE
jgi:hypothetical protein